MLKDTTNPALHTFRAVCDGLALRTAQRRRHEGAAVHAAAEQRQIGRLERQAAPFGLDEDGPASSACIEASSLALLAIVLRPPPKRVDFDASTLPEMLSEPACMPTTCALVLRGTFRARSCYKLLDTCLCFPPFESEFLDFGWGQLS